MPKLPNSDFTNDLAEIPNQAIPQKFEYFMSQVVVAAAERCLDPIPLEPAILERLVQAKLTKG